MKLFDFVSQNDDSYLLRVSARKWILEHGFPTRNADTWCYTNLHEILSHSFRDNVAQTESLELSQKIKDLNGSKLIFVNGRYSEQLSTRDINCGFKTSVLDADDTITNDDYSDGFSALNILYAAECICIEIPKNTKIQDPIHLVFISSESDIVSHPKIIVNIGSGSKCSIIEHYICSRDIVYFTNSSLDLILEDRSVVDHYKLQNESLSAFHISRLNIKQAKSSSVSSNVISLGAKLSRSEVIVSLGQYAHADLNGVYLPAAGQCHDNQVRVEHIATHSTSSEKYKGIVGQGGYGIFDGLISVCEGAIKTNAMMSNKNLLLSSDAHVSTRPRLEILNDDVKCSHGITTGRIDESVMLYLSSRGISKKEAMIMITESFAGEIVNLIKIDSLREYIKNMVSDKLKSLSIVE